MAHFLPLEEDLEKVISIHNCPRAMQTGSLSCMTHVHNHQMGSAYILYDHDLALVMIRQVLVLNGSHKCRLRSVADPSL